MRFIEGENNCDREYCNFHRKAETSVFHERKANKLHKHDKNVGKSAATKGWQESENWLGLHLHLSSLINRLTHSLDSKYFCSPKTLNLLLTTEMSSVF